MNMLKIAPEIYIHKLQVYRDLQVLNQDNQEEKLAMVMCGLGT